MKKSDIILIAVLLVVALVSYLAFRQITNDSALEDGTAIIFYNNQKILEIDLVDGSHEVFDQSRILSIDDIDSVFHVEGSNPYGVYIEYSNNKVRVIDEESPKHICQTQGWSNSPLQPLTCLPNNIIIVIEAKKDDSLPDDITG